MRAIRIGAVVLGVALTACQANGGKGKYANDGDTGAAAPATVVDTASVRHVGDSTTSPNLPQASGHASPAGDTVSGRTDSGANAAFPPAKKKKR